MKPKPSNHAIAIALALCSLLLIIAAILRFDTRLLYLSDTTRIEIHRGDELHGAKSIHSMPAANRGGNEEATKTPLETSAGSSKSAPLGANFRPIMSIVTTNVGYPQEFLPEPMPKKVATGKIVSLDDHDGEPTDQIHNPAKSLLSNPFKKVSVGQGGKRAATESAVKSQVPPPVDGPLLPKFIWEITTDPWKDSQEKQIEGAQTPEDELTLPTHDSSQNQILDLENQDNIESGSQLVDQSIFSLMNDVDDVVEDSVPRFLADFFNDWLTVNRYEMQSEEDGEYDEFDFPYAALHPKLNLGRRTYRRFDDYEDDPVFDLVSMQ